MWGEFCGNERFGRACGAHVDLFLLGGERVPDPRHGEESGVPLNRCGDVVAGGRDGGSRLVSFSDGPGSGGGSPRGGRGPGSPLAGWGGLRNHCEDVGRGCREDRGGLDRELNCLSVVHSATGTGVGFDMSFVTWNCASLLGLLRETRLGGRHVAPKRTRLLVWR